MREYFSCLFHFYNIELFDTSVHFAVSEDWKKFTFHKQYELQYEFRTLNCYKFNFKLIFMSNQNNK